MLEMADRGINPFPKSNGVLGALPFALEWCNVDVCPWLTSEVIVLDARCLFQSHCDQLWDHMTGGKRPDLCIVGKETEIL